MMTNKQNDTAPGVRSNELTAPHEVIEKDIEQKIADAEKMTKVTLQLTAAEVAGLEREAAALGVKWQTHLLSLVQGLLTERVGVSLITGPSFASKKIRGATNYGGSKFG